MVEDASAKAEKGRKKTPPSGTQKNSTKEILVKWVRSPNLGVLQVKVFLLSIHIPTFALAQF